MRGGHSLRSFLDFTVTQEQFGVTAVTAAIQKAPGTPSAQFLPVLRAAVTTEFWHVQALKAIGARPAGARRGSSGRLSPAGTGPQGRHRGQSGVIQDQGAPSSQW